MLTVQQVVGHALQGTTAGTYFGGDTPAALKACVRAVKLPAPQPPAGHQKGTHVETDNPTMQISIHRPSSGSQELQQSDL